jgi:hypothetical protein
LTRKLTSYSFLVSTKCLESGCAALQSLHTNVVSSGISTTSPG